MRAEDLPRAVQKMKSGTPQSYVRAIKPAFPHLKEISFKMTITLEGGVTSNCIYLQSFQINIHLMCAPEGNSEFCFPESLNVSRDEVEGNIETRGKTKLTISRGSTH